MAGFLLACNRIDWLDAQAKETGVRGASDSHAATFSTRLAGLSQT